MKHLRLEEAGGNVVLILNVAGRSANVLSREVVQELDDTLVSVDGRIKNGEQIGGLIIRSGKDSGFIVGADVTEFQHIEEAEQAAELARSGQQMLNHLAALTIPTVAVIHGNCLGGGLELVLACDYRIAREDAGTRLGSPEVRLGIHPGFAGTIRLPKLIGPFSALDMMLTGRTLSSRAARRIGLVDDIVPERHFMRAAASIIKKRPRKTRPALWKRLAGWLPLRPWVARMVRRQLRQKVKRDHYPAPYRIVDLWVRGAGQKREAASLGELLVGETSRHLVEIFFLSEGLKHRGRQTAHNIRHVHVIGAGVMGGDIASWAAYKGFTVTLQDLHEKSLARAIKRAHGLFTKKLRQPRLVQEAMDRLIPDQPGAGLKRADLVIEAVVESLDVKRQIFQKAEEAVGKDTILATNTSSIPLEEIAEGLPDPSRLVGLHFFNPVAKMQLVEVVRGRQTADHIVDQARAFTVSLDRLPLDVKSSPGFLVNRILMPYLMEAMVMVEEGISRADIDRAATEFGMPMGPIHLADAVGLDICLSVAEELAGPLGMTVPDKLRTMVDEGRLGKKSGRGFYRYDKKGKPARAEGKTRLDIPIADRLILRQLNEAIACLREQVVADADAVDAGMVFGTGFAPFRGGPMRYVETLGQSEVTHSLFRLVEAYGKRFEPDEGWSSPELFERHS